MSSSNSQTNSTSCRVHPSHLTRNSSDANTIPTLHSKRPSTTGGEQGGDGSAEPEEEDFMSDKFIQQYTSMDGNNQTYSEKRKRKLLQGSTIQQKKSRAQREVEAREEGLSRNLINPNSTSSQPSLQTESHGKAVQMMLKMGFQPGTSLGLSNLTSKNSNNNPIHIVPKSDRSGLGIPIKSKLSLTKFPQLLFGNKGDIKLTEEESAQREAFLESSRARFDSRKVEGVLSKARRTCEELDRRSGLQSNLLWLPSHHQEDRDHPPLTTTLDQLINQDLSKDHDDLNPFVESSSLEEEAEKNWLALEPSTRLSYTLEYLRQEYFYCIWCGCQFESSEELERECPGEEDDH